MNEENIEKINSDSLIDINKLLEYINRFELFVREKDNNKYGKISFRDRSGYLGREEDYKSSVSENARSALDTKKWKESMIGNGGIAGNVINAMMKSDNLVNKNQKTDFKNRICSGGKDFLKEVERLFYDLYKKNSCNDEELFGRIISLFGAKYDTVSYLFFIKDDSRYLPICPGHFDRGFKKLGIDLITSRRCNWENYSKFINVIKEIRDVLSDILPVDGILRLIDAHSFVWIIQQDRFEKRILSSEEQAEIEDILEKFDYRVVEGKGSKRSYITESYNRNQEVKRVTKERANGTCQLCLKRAPFIDNEGNPYLEVHHVEWLSKGGLDSTLNTVALCPNCHRKMHVLNEEADVKKLKDVLKNYEGSNNCDK